MGLVIELSRTVLGYLETGNSQAAELQPNSPVREFAAALDASAVTESEVDEFMRNPT